MAGPAITTSISAVVASWFTPSSLFLFVNLVIGTIALISRFTTPKKPTHQPEFGIHDAGSPQLVRSSSLLERFKSVHFGLYKYDPTFPETEYVQPVQDSPQLVRTPSLLERVKSFHFGHYNHEPTVAETEYAKSDTPECDNPCPNPEHSTQPQLERAPSLLERLKSMKFSSLCRSDSIKEKKETEVDGQDSNPEHDSGNLVGRSKSETHEESLARGPEKMKKSASEKSASRSWAEEEAATVERRRPETVRSERKSEQAPETASFVEKEGVDAKADDFINRFKQQLKLQRLDSVLRSRGK